jgi:organic radical activating enzyme
VPDRYRVIDGKIHNSSCEINVAEHCNLSCKGCSHLSPVLPKHFVSPADVLADLSILARHYRVDAVRILGGEPLLHPDLPGVAAAVRESGVTERICVVTNGLLLARMDESFWLAVDEIEVSLYPGRSPTAEQRSSFEGQARTHEVELSLNRVHHFRQSYTEVANTDRALIERVCRSCKIIHVWRCHTVANGMFFRCPQSYFLPRVLGEHFAESDVDALRIEDTDDFGERLFDFLTSADPPASCAQCLGTSGHLVSHVQVRPAEFRAAQEISAREMLSHRQGNRWLRARGRKPLNSAHGRVRRALARGARSLER